MIKVQIITVGNLKEKYLQDIQKEYVKRISRFSSINIIEIEEEKLPKNYSEADISKCLIKEQMKIEKYLQGFIVALDILGKQITSVELADKFKTIALNYDTITFVIGSSFGLSEDIKRKANFNLSFSKMTFPHQLFRIMLLEQTYRAFTINNNILYHK